MNIAIDIDDTLTESFEYFQRYFAEYLGVDLEELREKNISYCTLPEELEKEGIQFAKAYFDRIAADTPFKEDAAWGVNKLRELGHRIVIITARTTGVYTDPYVTSAQELKNGGIIYDKLICTSDKATACVAESISVLVDDHPKNCDAVAAKGVTALLFESKGNQNINTEHCRVKNWKEVLEEIIKLSY